MSFYSFFLAAAKRDHAGTDHSVFPEAGMVTLCRLIPHLGTFEPDLPSQPPSPGVVFDFEYIVVFQPYPEHPQSIISAASPNTAGCDKKASSLCMGFSAI
ncbi:hypothetical protein QR685DRAFT_573714 [Neurospora intermedia]|uniref:Uncharacterized protein n=1 Tax=Neurospora intermedia TaxID=5142 RepID=A0ABR3D6W3_NEUIN